MNSAAKFLVELVQRVLKLKRPYKIALASILLLILLILVFPFQLQTAPEWRVRVVDTSDQPVAGIKVTEHWQHYLLESDGHEEVRTSNGDGRVTFPERTIRAGLLSRFVTRIRKNFRKGNEARTDNYASIVAWGSRDHEIATAVYRPPTPPQEKIVVRRQFALLKSYDEEIAVVGFRNPNR